MARITFCGLFAACVFALVSAQPRYGGWTYPKPTSTTTPPDAGPGVTTKNVTQAQADKIGAALDQIASNDGGNGALLAAQIAMQIGASQGGSGSPGNTTVVSMESTDGEKRYGTTSPDGAVIGIDFSRLYHQSLVSITLVHEYYHVIGNMPGGKYPTSKAAIRAKYPGAGLSDADIDAIAQCNHASIWAESALALSKTDTSGMSKSQLLKCCRAFRLLYWGGRGEYADCVAAKEEAGGDSAGDEVEEASDKADTFYKDKNKNDKDDQNEVDELSTCCHAYKES